MIKQGTSEKLVKKVYLAIGSNLGNRILNIHKTKIQLFKNNIKILKSSGYYESPSWPDPNFPKFLNIVLKIETNFTEIELLYLCKKIEKFFGRKKTPKNSPRVCDIDILDYGQKITKKGINLPHPRMHKRNFVLIPLFEIDKKWKHPISKRCIKKLIFSLPNRDITSIKQI